MAREIRRKAEDRIEVLPPKFPQEAIDQFLDGFAVLLARILTEGGDRHEDGGDLREVQHRSPA